MNRIFLILIISFFSFSCSSDNDRIERNHEIVNILLKDRMKLINHVQILQDTQDTIRVFSMTLIGNSMNKITYDSVRNSLVIFSYHTPPINHPFFKDSTEYILNQLSTLPSTKWDSTLIECKIPIDYPEKELKEDTSHKTTKWLLKYKKEKSFLVISEPIENVNGEITASAKLFTSNYNIDKSYILKKENNEWTIADNSTIVSKVILKEFDNRTEEVEICVGYYDL